MDEDSVTDNCNVSDTMSPSQQGQRDPLPVQKTASWSSSNMLTRHLSVSVELQSHSEKMPIKWALGS